MLTIVSKQKPFASLGLGMAVALSLATDTALAAVDQNEATLAEDKAPVAKVSHMRDDDVDHITLDLAEPAGHVLQQDGDQLIIWLDQPREFDLSSLSEAEQTRLVGVRTPNAGPTRWMVLDLAPGSKVESELQGDQRLVIKINGAQAAPSDARPVAQATAVEPTPQTATKPQKKAVKEVRTPDTPKASLAKQKPDDVVDGIDAATTKKVEKPNKSKTAAAGPKLRTPRPGAPRPLLPVSQSSTEAAPSTAEPKVPPKPKASLPGQFEVDETALDRALERTLASEGVVLMPFGMVEIEPSLTYVRQEIDTPSLINLFGFPAFGETEVERNDYIASLAARIGLPFDSQLELDVPFSYVDQSEMTTIGFDPIDEVEDDTGAFGDLRVGLAKTLMKEGGWRPDVVARVSWDSQTGKSVSNGIALGGGNHELTGSLSLVKSQDPLAFFGSVSYEKTFEEDNLDPGDRVGISIGTVLAASPETSLRASLRQDFTGDAEFEGNELDGTDQMAATLSIGASSILGRGILLDASADVGLTDDAPDYAARISLPIRFNVRPMLSSLGAGRSSDDSDPEEGANPEEG